MNPPPTPAGPPTFQFKPTRQPMLWAALAYSLGIVAGIAVSTAMEGSAPSDLPLAFASIGTLAESSPTRPRSLYAQTKLALFRELQNSGVETAWTRFFYLYGPFEDPERLMPVIIAQTSLRTVPRSTSLTGGIIKPSW